MPLEALPSSRKRQTCIGRCEDRNQEDSTIFYGYKCAQLRIMKAITERVCAKVKAANVFSEALSENEGSRRALENPVVRGQSGLAVVLARQAKPAFAKAYSRAAAAFGRSVLQSRPLRVQRAPEPPPSGVHAQKPPPSGERASRSRRLRACVLRSRRLRASALLGAAAFGRSVLQSRRLRACVLRSRRLRASALLGAAALGPSSEAAAFGRARFSEPPPSGAACSRAAAFGRACSEAAAFGRARFSEPPPSGAACSRAAAFARAQKPLPWASVLQSRLWHVRSQRAPCRA